MTTPQAAVLQVEHLTTAFATREGTALAVNDVSFQLRPGEILGLVGESGSGKSMTGFSLMGLVDAPGAITGGRILFKGEDLRYHAEEQWRHLRGNRIAMIFQDPMMTLNPVLRIDTQMIEAVRAHQRVSKKVARTMAHDALVRVGIPAADERLKAYPHQLSGGMRQRVAIAIALLNKPDLIIADEPTTALDVSIQAQILFEMQKLCREAGTALIWITHDLSVVAGLADRVCVMYAGRIVEEGITRDVLESPAHPYTQGLLDSTPAAAEARGHERGEPLLQIPGSTPSLLKLPNGCSFRPRCSRASEQCQTLPEERELSPAHFARCFHPVVGYPPCRTKDVTDV